MHLKNVLNTSWRYLEDVLTRTASQFDTASKCLEDVLKTSLQDSLKPSWIFFEETSWRIKDVLKEVQNVIKKSSRRVEDVLKTFLQDVLKMSLRRLQNICQDEYIHLDQDVLKLYWRHMTEANIFVLIKTSWKQFEDIF